MTKYWKANKAISAKIIELAAEWNDVLARARKISRRI